MTHRTPRVGTGEDQRTNNLAASTCSQGITAFRPLGGDNLNAVLDELALLTGKWAEKVPPDSKIGIPNVYASPAQIEDGVLPDAIARVSMINRQAFRRRENAIKVSEVLRRDAYRVIRRDVPTLSEELPVRAVAVVSVDPDRVRRGYIGFRLSAEDESVVERERLGIWDALGSEELHEGRKVQMNPNDGFLDLVIMGLPYRTPESVTKALTAHVERRTIARNGSFDIMLQQAALLPRLPEE